MSRLSIAAVVAVGVLAAGLTGHARPQGRSDLALAALAAHAHVSDQVLVQFRREVGAQAKQEVLARFGAKRQEMLVAARGRDDFKGDLELVRLPPGLAVATAVRGLEEEANVEFAEPNWIYTHDATSNDPYYMNGSLWGMYGTTTSPKNTYGSQAAAAWAANHTGAADVYVGIIDEGYMYAHEDLAANAGTNPGEIAGNGKDDDGNGYVDDVYGWDFDKNDNTVFDGTADDHGTHVAGTIGAVGGNGKGVAGVCWTVRLLDAKFLGKRGGTTASAIKAVDYFTNLRKAGVNIVATNNSWGGGGFSQALQDAITRAGNADILFIAAAGNDGRDIDASPSYPASYPNTNIIAVASITSTGGLSSFSNWGKTSVDLGAPGSAIYSSVPKSSKGNIVSGYASYSGTSMATPHVTGAVALYAAYHSGASAAQIKAAIMSATTATTSLSNKSVSGGRLNLSGF